MTKVIDTLTTRGLPWSLPEVVGTVQHVHCNRRRLLRRGLKFHVCTINKSAHTKKNLETYLMILVILIFPNFYICHLTTLIVKKYNLHIHCSYKPPSTQKSETKSIYYKYSYYFHANISITVESHLKYFRDYLYEYELFLKVTSLELYSLK